MKNKNLPLGFLVLFAVFVAAPFAHAQQPSQPNVIYLNAGAIDTSAPQTQARAKALAATAGKQLRLIQFDGPIQPEWVADLENSGLRIVDYVPENAYLVYGDIPAVQSMQAKAAAKSHVRWEGAYRGVDKIHPVAAESVSAKATESRPDPTLFSIQLILDPSTNPATLALIESLKLKPVIRQGPNDKYYNIVVSLPPGTISQISDRSDVISILPYNTPQKRDEKQCIIMTGQLSGNTPTGPGYLTWLANKGFTQAQFDASGLVVDVTDSPIDNGGTTAVNHFALYKDGTISNSSPSRVVYNRLEGTANTGSITQAQDGHGNLNAHIIAGQVNLTNSPHADANGYRYGMGVAPFVKVGGSIIFDTSSFTSPNYDNLAARAYRDGARVSGNSWGADTAGAYDSDAQNYDYLVRDAQRSVSVIPTAGNQQMTFVFAAGNAGSGASTVGSPGTAKNVITVGAAENVRAFGGADGSAVGDTGADSANDVIDFSSRGPCSDSRKKPDIMAPGTHITGGAPQAVKTMSGTGTKLAIFDGSGVSGGITNSMFFPSSGQQFYTASSGTSHSTPAVAGAAALVYQWFINKGWATSANPASPAMIKAYLMNAARYMTGTFANDSLYSNSQGMGMVNLDSSFDETPRFLRDQQTADIFTASGQTRTWTGTIAGSAKPVRITLAWTDAPGSTTGNAYKNNLDLTVTVNGTTYRGNVFSGANSATGGTADVRNNVESVFLPAGTTGSVTITVSGTNINSDGVPNYGTTIDQDFALVAYNFNEVLAPSIVSAGSSLVAEGDSPANNAIDPDETVTVGFALRNAGSLDTANVTATLLATNGVTPITSGPVSYGALLTNGLPAVNNFQFRVAGTVGNNFDAVLAIQDGTNNLGTVPYTFRLGPPPPVVLSEDFATLTSGNDITTTGPSTTEITTNLTTNFPTSSKAYSAGGAVKLGSGSSVGSMTSVPLDVSGNSGNFSVKFDVKGWTTVEGQIKVTAGSLPSQTVSYTATVASNYQTKTLNFSGGTAGTTIKIETTAKRAFIDNVQVLSAASAATPVIYSPLTAAGSVGTAFNYAILASNAPTSFGATGLPAGLTNNAATGIISGTPTTAGTNNVTISASNAGGTDTKTLVLTVSPAPVAPVISSALTASGVVGSSFSYQVAASGSPSSYGATGLPDGLSINTVTGAITGTPSTAGTYTVGISATNSAGTGSATLVITVTSASLPAISSALTASGTAGSSFSYQITASGSPTSFGATGLPVGLTINTGTGAITGTPTATGTYNVVISASNAGGTGSATLLLTISPASSGGTNGVLAGWDVSGQSAYGVSPLTPTTYATNFVSVGGLTRSAAVGTSTGTAASRAWGGYGWTNTNAYASFSLTIAAGYKMSVTNINVFDYRRPATGATNGSIQFSTNGTDFVTATNLVYSSSASSGASAGPINLSGVSALQDLPGGTTVTFRLVNTGATSGTGTWYVYDRASSAANDFEISGSIVGGNSGATPVVAATGSLGALNAVYGTVSTNPGSFTLTGSNLTADAVVAAPAGFEVSQTAGGASGYAASQTITPAGGVVSNTIYVRLTAAAAGTYSGPILCNSTGAAGATIAIPASTVAKKGVTVAGLTGENKVYDATTSATFTGTPVYDGLVNGDSYTVSGSPSASFASAGAGTNKAVTVTGYNAPSGDYNILPTTLAADITPKPLGISGLFGIAKIYDGTTAGSLGGTAELTGVEPADSGNVSPGGSPVAEFLSANAGADIGMIVSGYALSGSAAANYSLVQPGTLTAEITPRPATVTASDRSKPAGTALPLGPNQTSGFTATGLVVGERVDKVTLTASGGTAAEDPAGIYSITPSDAATVPSIPPNPFRADNYSMTYVNGTLTVTSGASPAFDDWMTQNYPELSGSEAQVTADPDNDGLANLLEYYMGLSPVAADHNAVTLGWNPGSPSSVSMTYRRAKNTAGVSGGVSWTSVLNSGNWSTAGVTENATDGGAYDSVTATVTNAPDEARKFLRLKVEQQ